MAAGYAPYPCQSTTGGVGNVASPCGNSPGARGYLKERETGCLRSRSKGPFVTRVSNMWAEWGRQMSVLWLQGCPADWN